MTISARCGDGLAVFVGPVAAEALFGVVDLNGRGRALRGQVAVRAISGLVRVRVERLPTRQRLEGFDRGVVGEAMAEGTVGLARAAELRVRFRGGVRELGLLFVTRGASLRSDRSHLTVADAVAHIARDMLPDDVHVVAADLARQRPHRGHVDALARVW